MADSTSTPVPEQPVATQPTPAAPASTPSSKSAYQRLLRPMLAHELEAP